ncbi:MAG: bifunctional tRNA (5-methylaminomethyl-2-thiouridine)(34)-methyltransferase MnmD/FAD-dependent 5-carboxymethylaminomethyl-2-thiouridine(34) oxidoreductase MnmC [Rhodocyclaceae bacterium]
MTALRPARLHLADNGIPYSSEYDDIYYSDGGALEQAEQVFLAGNALPARWHGRTQFVIAETGFGLGHNFLATWDAWRRDPQRPERLHFISVEKHPFTAADMGAAHARSGAPLDLSHALRTRWPMLMPGVHRIELADGAVILTLLLGDAETMLAGYDAQVDAIYLDGFSPSHNASMWSPAVFSQLARLAAPGCTLATWSASGAVRGALSEAGFVVAKASGFGSKRHMLKGLWPATEPAPKADTGKRHAIVIGAGLAGTGITERLAARGWQVSLFDEHPRPAQGASGNVAGAFRPLPSADDNLLSRVTRAGFLYGLQHLSQLHERGHAVRWDACGVLHIARDAKQAAKQAETVAALHAPADFVQFVDADYASALCGQPTAAGGWWFPRGGWVSPPSLCEANLAAANGRVHTVFNARVARLVRRNDHWVVYDENDAELARAPHVVLANAHDARRLGGVDWLPLRPARGQVTHMPSSSGGELRTVVCGSGYVTPDVDGVMPMGASFVVDDATTDLRDEEHAENISKLEKMLPSLAEDMRNIPSHDGRASVRPVSPDRLPMVGALDEGCWLLSGFGARGLVWGALCAELLATQMNNEPPPVERALALALAPDRFRPDERSLSS